MNKIVEGLIKFVVTTALAITADVICMVISNKFSSTPAPTYTPPPAPKVSKSNKKENES